MPVKMSIKDRLEGKNHSPKHNRQPESAWKEGLALIGSGSAGMG